MRMNEREQFTINDLWPDKAMKADLIGSNVLASLHQTGVPNRRSASG